MAMARSWVTLLILCLISLASFSCSAKRHNSRSRGQNQERAPALGPQRASFVNGTNILDWSRDPRRVDQQIYDQTEALAWEFFSWPYAMTGQLEGQELAAGLVNGDRVEPKSKSQLLACNGEFKLDLSPVYPDDHYEVQPSGESPIIQHLMKYPMFSAAELPMIKFNPKFMEICPDEEVPCPTYKLRGQPRTINGTIGGTCAKFTYRIQDLLHDYGPLALYMESAAQGIDADGFIKIEKSWWDDFRKIRHAVLLVGYGFTDSGLKYFKFKNSRGPNWGDHGYGYLRAGKGSPPLRGKIELLHIEPCS